MNRLPKSKPVSIPMFKDRTGKTMAKSTLLYGWFSQKQLELSPHVSVYRKENGAEVVVTQVTSTPNHGTSWDDIKMVGRVNALVRTVDGPSPLSYTI